jgi:IS5 family transposase
LGRISPLDSPARSSALADEATVARPGVVHRASTRRRHRRREHDDGASAETFAPRASATVAIAATVGVRTRAEGGRFSLQLSSEHSLLREVAVGT